MDGDSFAANRSEIVRERLHSFLGGKVGLIMVMNVYMDESNIHPDANGHVTVAAAWATADVWADWTKDWEAAIRPFTFWHSSDIHNLSGMAKNMSRHERDEIVKRAMSVIRKHKIEGRIAHINKDLLNRLMGGAEAVANSGIENPYYPCFLWAVQRTAEIMKRKGIENVNFFHEDNEFMQGAYDHYRKLSTKHGFPDFSFSFAKKASHPPLQCADVFAYEGKHKLAKWDKPRPALEAADGGSNRIQFSKISDAQVAELANAFRLPPTET